MLWIDGKHHICLQKKRGINIIWTMCFRIHIVTLWIFTIEKFSWAYSFNRLNRDNTNKNDKSDGFHRHLSAIHSEGEVAKQKNKHNSSLRFNHSTHNTHVNFNILLCENQHQWTIRWRREFYRYSIITIEACLNNHIEPTILSSINNKRLRMTT